MQLIVIAKQPVPGRVKTRLCPPCTHQEAAAIAEAALADTLETVHAVSGADPVVVLDGEAGPWLPSGTRVVPQHGAGLARRLAFAFDEVGGPALLIGMDTPQVSAGLLGSACDRLATDADAVIGPALDGGWWAIGLRRPDGGIFTDVPMSTDRTHEVQRARLRERSLRVADLPALRDVDRAADAAEVACEVPGSRFAAAVASSPIGRSLALGNAS